MTKCKQLLVSLAAALATAVASEDYLRGASSHRTINTYEEDAGFAMEEDPSSETYYPPPVKENEPALTQGSDCAVPDGKDPKMYYQAKLTSLEVAIKVTEKNTAKGDLELSESLLDIVAPKVADLHKCLSRTASAEDFGLAQMEAYPELSDRLVELVQSLGDAGTNYLLAKYPGFDEDNTGFATEEDPSVETYYPPPVKENEPALSQGADCAVPDGKDPKMYYQARITSLKVAIEVAEKNTEKGDLEQSKSLLDTVAPKVAEFYKCLSRTGSTTEDFGLAQMEAYPELSDQVMELTKSLGDAGTNYLSAKYPGFDEEAEMYNPPPVESETNAEKAKELVMEVMEMLAESKEEEEDKLYLEQEASDAEEKMANFHSMVAIEDLHMKEVQDMIALDHQAFQENVLTQDEFENNIKNYENKVGYAKDFYSSVLDDVSSQEEIGMVQVEGYNQEEDAQQVGSELADLNNEIMNAENQIELLKQTLNAKDDEQEMGKEVGDLDQDEKIVEALLEVGLDQKNVEKVIAGIMSLEEDEATELNEEEKEELEKEEDEFRQ